MRTEQDAQREYEQFIHTIGDSKDLYANDKIKVLKYAADTCMLRNWNLLYLECKSIIDDLRTSANKSAA